MACIGLSKVIVHWDLPEVRPLESPFRGHLIWTMRPTWEKPAIRCFYRQMRSSWATSSIVGGIFRTRMDRFKSCYKLLVMCKTRKSQHTSSVNLSPITDIGDQTQFCLFVTDLVLHLPRWKASDPFKIWREYENKKINQKNKPMCKLYFALSRIIPSYCFLNHSMASSRVTLWE